MAMVAQLWSLNGLSTELGIDRRILAQRIEGLEPDKVEGCALLGQREDRYWYMRRVVEHLHGVQNSAKVTMDLNAQRARLAREQADKYAIENAKLREECILKEDILHVWSDALLVCKAKLLAIPDTLGQQLDRPTARRIVPTIREAISTALAELANYRAEGDTASDAGMEAAPEADINRVG